MPRLGGWIMSVYEARRWAGRILEKPAEDLTFADTFVALSRKLKPYRIGVACVNYPALFPKIMIVTQRAPWPGLKRGEDPLRIPQFIPGKNERWMRRALEKHGEKGKDLDVSLILI
jgi:hypothetical protein